MAKPKYGHLIKNFSFKDYGPGDFRQGTKMAGDFFGYDVCMEYGTFYAAGRMSKTPNQAVAHDYDKVMIWMGTDTYDMGYLGAEVELCLGEEKEKHMITTATAVAVPKGTPYLPADITRMDDRFIFMTISLAPETKATPVTLDDRLPQPADFMRSKFRENVQHLAFTRNGPWHYGPLNADTHDGAITDIHGKDFEFHMSYESMNRAPYRFGPIPDKPHVHPYTEFLLFMGADCDDLSDLGAEVEMYMGKEMEKHVITTPSVAIQPKGHAHCPLIVNKQDKPWIFAVVRPWGHGGRGKSGYLP
jgi:hypothetical protein